MSRLVLWCLLLGTECASYVSANVADLQLTFNTKAMGLSMRSLEGALKTHSPSPLFIMEDHLTESDTQTAAMRSQESMSLLCTSYHESRAIHSLLAEVNAKQHQYHPVYASQARNRQCFIYHGPVMTTTPPTDTDTVTVTTVPFVLKIDPSVDFTLRSSSSVTQSTPIILELALFTGVANPSSMCCEDHERVFADMTSALTRVLLHPEQKTQHQSTFFFTRQTEIEEKKDDDDAYLSRHRANYEASFAVDHTYCQDVFAKASVTYSDTHISITLATEHGKTAASCVRMWVSIASVHPSVSHISAHYAPITLFDESVTSEDDTTSDSVDYKLAKSVTDQNAYIQSGTSDQYPYTAGLGLNGGGYVLGMIDSGIDDLSCFLRDWNASNTSEITTRTAKSGYHTPITEPFRRKVVQVRRIYTIQHTCCIDADRCLFCC